jgi:hypothetical protein
VDFPILNEKHNSVLVFGQLVNVVLRKNKHNICEQKYN